MITNIIEFNNTLIKHLENVKRQSFQKVLEKIGNKYIIFDSDQILPEH